MGTVCSDAELTISLGSLSFAGEGMRVSCLYPQKEETAFRMEGDTLTVTFEKPVMARLFVIEKRNVIC